MLHILKIEWLKIKKYPAFWWMFGIVALTYPGINLIFFNVYNDITKRKDVAGALAKQLLGNPFAFPETWHSVAYFSSWFVMIPSILVIMVITNEYTYKTHRQNIIDGMSRQEFMLGKMIDVAIIAGVATIMCALVATGFGIYTSKYADRWAEQLHYIPLFFLQTFSQLSVSFFLGFIIRKAFIALGVLMFYVVIVENAAVAYLKYQKLDFIGKFFPLEMSDRLLPVPAFLGKIDQEAYDKSLNAVTEHTIYTIILTAFIWWGCIYLYKKRDL